MKTNNQDQINRAAWAACDTFRGVVDPSQYKDYILIFLFWKFISDVWAHHYATFERQYGGNEERLRRRMERERFVLPEGTAFEDVFRRCTADNVGELINIALEAIEEANRAKLAGILSGIDFNSENNLGETADRNRRLKTLFEDFHKPELDFNPARFGGEGQAEDAIGETYIYLIGQFASDAGKKAGEFFTPRRVSELLVKLADPQPGHRICDPTCGSGSLLIRAAEHVARAEGKDEAREANVQLFGQEVTRQTHGLARMNMFLHGLDGARIEWGDTLNAPKLLSGDDLMRFDTVLANPPFSLDKWGDADKAKKDRYARFHRGVPPKSRGDFAFVSHMVETAAPRKGRVAVVAPHGVLFRGGAEGRIRQALVEENLLDAIVGLPAQLFPSTGIPVCLVVFDRARERGGEREKADEVMVIDASRDFDPGKKQNQLSDAHIARIVETYHAREAVERYAEPVSREAIRKNGYNLNIPRYVDTHEPEPEIDVAALQREIEGLEDELAKTRTRMDAMLRELGVDA